MGRNSAVRRIIMVEIIVWVSRLKSVRSRLMNPTDVGDILINHSIKTSPIKRPYTTRAILFPISIVAINLEGFSVRRVNIFARKPSCFFSISIWILFAETNAISIPEKKAEKSKDKIMTTMAVSKTTPCFHVAVARIFCDIFYGIRTSLLKLFQKRQIDMHNCDQYSKPD